jgi:hypothetical protein
LVIQISRILAPASTPVLGKLGNYYRKSKPIADNDKGNDFSMCLALF